MSVAETIEQKLRVRFSPTRLKIVDDSGRHAGHAGARPGGETHFTIAIVSPAFAVLGQAPVDICKQFVGFGPEDLKRFFVHLEIFRSRCHLLSFYVWQQIVKRRIDEARNVRKEFARSKRYAQKRRFEPGDAVEDRIYGIGMVGRIVGRW